MMKRLAVFLTMLVFAALACNAPISEEGSPPSGGPAEDLAGAWQQALALSQGQFNVTLTEEMIEDAIYQRVSQQNADIQRDDINITINADGTMQLSFAFIIPNLGAEAQAAVDYTLGITDVGDLNVTVQSATVGGPGGVSVNVPTDVLTTYNESINNALTGANFMAADAEITLTDLAFEQGSVTISGQVSR